MSSSVDFGAVSNLLGRYCDAVARFDIEAFGSVWAADAVWHLSGGDDRHGREAIVALFRQAREPFDLCIQEILSSTVEPSGRARSYLRELQWRKDGETRQLIGFYDDAFVGPSNAPLFASRRFSVLYRGPIDLPGRLSDASKPGPV